MWELQQAGLPSTLVTEGAASWVISEKGVKWVIVGADRIAAMQIQPIKLVPII